ncbi:E1 [human papillomavirus 164]|uniref:Replication protein E1 n=1 Tax=human papillomavirus 164 TaxID=1315261 RepID=K4MKS9_9PAPI|nr:E1 [human papillomavirus 164]
MADLTKGTDDSFEKIETDSSWFIISEAECRNDIDSFETIFEESTDGSLVSDIIDDVDDASQGNSLALFNRQIADDCNKAITDLKRKYLTSPQQCVAELSPRLEAVKISGEGKSKRRLFQDSGIEEDEIASTSQVLSEINNTVPAEADETLDLLKCNNRKATLLWKIKEVFAVSFSELTRLYKSDKTCSLCWVVAVCNVSEDLLNSSKILLQQHVDFVQIITVGRYALYLIEFKTGKSRETVSKMFCKLLNVKDYGLLCQPPKLRSVAVALYFYKRSLSNVSFKYGEFPEWLSKQILLDHNVGSQDTFSLSDMVQWAFDHDYLDESEIAYNYAIAATENANAAAFLQSNNQAKHVKDCAIMVKHYKRYELRQMSMAGWIKKCCADYEEENNWKPIAHFLRFQGVNFLEFLIAFKPFLQGLPKKNCMVFWGPPDSGKSLFCFSLLNFLKGRVISYMNSKSHFWLMPLFDCKLGLLDDATYPCWQYMDVHLRNAMDGNVISIDLKHKAPVQLSLPPLLVSTNVNVLQDQSLKYLHSRIKCFNFPNVLPTLANGEIAYKVTNNTWACFFRKFASHLDIAEDDGGDTGNINTAFQCTARRNIEHY